MSSFQTTSRIGTMNYRDLMQRIPNPARQMLLMGMFFLLFSCSSDPEIEPVETTCVSATPIGGISISPSAEIQFVFNTSGGGEVTIRNNGDIIVKHGDYETFKIELWGYIDDGGNKLKAGSHENLGGKHIKDRIGNSRTILFPDGAKVTLVAAGPYEPMTAISFYDGVQSHRVNMGCSGGPVLEHSSSDGSVAKRLDDAEIDGEAGGFVFTETGVSFINFYRENQPGVRIEEEVLLGKMFRDNPTQVDDNFDDPRLEHT